MPLPTLNPLIRSLSAPPVPSVLAWGREYGGDRGPLIDLSQAVPGYPPHPDMLAWLSEAAGSRRFTGYGAIEGEDELRQAYAAHETALYGAPLEAGNIHITSGANQAFISVLMAVAGHGDSVALTNPFYFNQETTMAMLGIRPVTIECDHAGGFLPGIDAVRSALATGVKALVLVTPNNPTGAIYPAGLLRQIFDLCRANGAWLILDETYRDFLPAEEEQPHGLFAVADWQDTLISLYSFSKSFCIPGHRLGAVTAGPEVVEQVAKVMDNLQICAPRSAQAAVARALPALKEWRDGNRNEIMHRAAALKGVMAELPAWKMDAIGAYFAFIRHPFDGVSSALVAEKLAKQAGIVCLPGVYFGPTQDAYLRFAFANATSETIGRLTERLQGFAI